MVLIGSSVNRGVALKPKQSVHPDSNSQPYYSVYVKVGDETRQIYASINIDRLMKHSKLAATVSPNEKEETTTSGKKNRAITLPIDTSFTTRKGVSYVLKAINLTAIDSNLFIRPVANLSANIQIYSAIKELNLVWSQGTLRHYILMKISQATPTAELLIMAHLLRNSDAGVYNRALTRTAEWIISGGADVQPAAKKLVEEIEHIDPLYHDLNRCFMVQVAKHGIVTNQAEDDYAARKARREQSAWELKQGLREAEEHEIRNMSRWNWR